MILFFKNYCCLKASNEYNICVNVPQWFSIAIFKTAVVTFFCMLVGEQRFGIQPWLTAALHQSRKFFLEFANCGVNDEFWCF